MKEKKFISKKVYAIILEKTLKNLDFFRIFSKMNNKYVLTEREG